MAYPYAPYYQPYSYNYYQPQQTQAQQTPTQSSILWVRNNQEAAMYPVAPNNAVVLWDSSAPVIYLKQADASGKPTMKTYDLVERSEKPAETANASADKGQGYATKTELDALAEAVRGIDGVMTNLKEEIDLVKYRIDKKTTLKREDRDDG